MGYYPPLTDYLADWRMDQIKGEDLQDPTARQQISALSTSVNTLSQQVTTLSVSVANKVSKSGDTMTGDLVMGQNTTSTSKSLVLRDSAESVGLKKAYENLSIYFQRNNENPRWLYNLPGHVGFSNPGDVLRCNTSNNTWVLYVINLSTKYASARYLLVYDFNSSNTDKKLIWSLVDPISYNENQVLTFTYDTDSSSPAGTWTFTYPSESAHTEIDEDGCKLLYFTDQEAGYAYVLARNYPREFPVQQNELPVTFSGTVTLATGTVSINGGNASAYTQMSLLAGCGIKVSLRVSITDLSGQEVEFPMTAYNSTLATVHFSGVVMAQLTGGYAPTFCAVTIGADGSATIHISQSVNKSGDTMQGNLSMGGPSQGGSYKLYFPEGNSDPSSQNFIGWRLENDYGFFELSSQGYSANTLIRFSESFSYPNAVMISQHFCNTWRGAAFMNGELALKFQMEGFDEWHDYYVKGPEQVSTPVQRLSWDNDQSFWQLTTSMGTFQLAGSTNDTFLQFGATVQGVRYDVYLFKNVGNAIVLPSDIPLIVNATFDDQTGAVTFDQQWDQVAYQAMMGRVIHVRTTIDGCTHEIPLTFADPTSYCLSFSGIYNTDGAAMVPRQLTILWSANPNISSGARSYILANDDTVEALVTDVSTLSTSVSTLDTSVTTLSKGYPVVVPTKSITSGTDAVTATNRAVTSLSYVAADSVSAVNLTFPSINSGFSRDFILYIDFAPNNLVVNLPVSGVTFIVPEGENLSDMTSIDSGAAANIYFSEVKANTFAVHRVTFEAAV